MKQLRGNNFKIDKKIDPPSASAHPRGPSVRLTRNSLPASLGRYEGHSVIFINVISASLNIFFLITNFRI